MSSTEEKLNTIKLEIEKITKEKDETEKKLKDLTKTRDKLLNERDKLQEKHRKEMIKEMEKISRKTEKLSSENEEIKRAKSESDVKIESERRAREEAEQKAENIQKAIFGATAELTKVVVPDSVIYLLDLGTTEQLKDIFKIPSDIISKKIKVYKFGLTNSYERRFQQHMTTYKNKLGCENFCEAFKQQSSILENRDNENRVKEFLKTNECIFITEDLKTSTKYNELVCLDTSELKKLKKFYEKNFK